LPRLSPTRCGPTLLEAKTYRYAGHSRADTAPYRVPGEFERWYERDPINTFRARLIDEGLLTAESAEQLEEAVGVALEELVAHVKESPFPEPAAMFRNVYA
jgi:pyruvate dehydrogenase E1 component alpha subunit